VTAAGSVADPLGGNRSQVAAALDSVLKRDPELSAVWFYDSANAALTEVPIVDPHILSGLVANQRIDPVNLLGSQLHAAEAGTPQAGSSGLGGGLSQSGKTQGVCGATSTPLRSERARR
jgi:hypothetical protein